MMCYDAIKLSHGENQSNLNLPNQNYYKKLMIFRQIMYRLRYCTIYNPPTLGEILISNQINSKVGVPAPLLYDIVNNGIQITDPVYIQGNGFTDILKNREPLLQLMLSKISELAQKIKKYVKLNDSKNLSRKTKSEIIRQQLISAHEDNQEQQQISNRAAQDRAKSDIEAVQAVIRHRKVGNGKKKTRKRRTRGRGLKEF
ncbi:hypothetical protein PAPYR_9814 [Paratrimastix pyriformis]|uniref:Uncharacterized protein n=1 Tax=Paratrimastix pyriformis TaxID=342808 RepID=A0ABQ8U7I5_9EUKA|nr:hypothetical protein PAPYR_9814 [Paratrimastix pyriformis]